MENSTSNKGIAFSIDFGTLPGQVSVFVSDDWERTIGNLGIADCHEQLENQNEDTDVETLGNYIAFYMDILKKVKKLSSSVKGFTATRLVNGKHHFIMLLKEFNFEDKDYVILAHEITHLIQFQLPYFFNRDRETEFEAYTHSHLMTQFLEKYREGMKDEEVIEKSTPDV
jgi:hypothetical protein